MKLLVTAIAGLLAGCGGMFDPVVYESNPPAQTSHSAKPARRPTNSYDAGTRKSPDTLLRLNRQAAAEQIQRNREAYADFRTQTAQNRIDEARAALAKAMTEKALADARRRQLQDDPAKAPDAPRY
jgi:hypothetical protein